jgi:hypothetical protein
MAIPGGAPSTSVPSCTGRVASVTSPRCGMASRAFMAKLSSEHQLLGEERLTGARLAHEDVDRVRRKAPAEHEVRLGVAGTDALHGVRHEAGSDAEGGELVNARTVAVSCSASIGLVRNASAPAARARP